MRHRRFDPSDKRFVTESETTSVRIRSKLRASFDDPFGWNFCELCWKTTEYVLAINTRAVFKRVNNDRAVPVAMSQAVMDKAQADADKIVDRYERALLGDFGPEEAGTLVRTYCNFFETQGDRSVTTFRSQVERAMQLSA